MLASSLRQPRDVGKPPWRLVPRPSEAGLQRVNARVDASDQRMGSSFSWLDPLEMVVCLWVFPSKPLKRGYPQRKVVTTGYDDLWISALGHRDLGDVPAMRPFGWGPQHPKATWGGGGSAAELLMSSMKMPSKSLVMSPSGDEVSSEVQWVCLFFELVPLCLVVSKEKTQFDGSPGKQTGYPNFYGNQMAP